MKTKPSLFARLLPRRGLLPITVLLMASPGRADVQEPGSLLLYPAFDNRLGNVSVITVTNAAGGGNPISVDFSYVGAFDSSGISTTCREESLLEPMTPNDTFSVLGSSHVPTYEQGFLYIFATDAEGKPIVHNYLIGNVMILTGFTSRDYSINAVSFRGLSDDVNGNGLRDLDGVEYQESTKLVLIPRFLGQSATFNSELVLIGLSGGPEATTVVDIFAYNDNEELYSTQALFRCWRRVELSAISAIFSNNFLQNVTNHDPGEIQGAPAVESGWMRILGNVASVGEEVIEAPAIFAVLLEGVGSKAVGTLPFGVGANSKGQLY